MAKEAGVSYSTIYKWRDNKSSPSLYLIESLCDVLEVHPSDVLIPENNCIYISDEEKYFFNYWKNLSKAHKAFLLEMVKALINKNQIDKSED